MARTPTRRRSRRRSTPPATRWPDFETFVGDNGYVLDRGFSIADCAVAPALWRSRRLPIDFGASPNFARLRETLTARVTFAAAGPVA